MNFSDIRYNRIYSDLSYLWPVISPPEDYRCEVETWIQIIRKALGPGTHDILELGAGGGSSLSCFGSKFRATAVDSSPRMLNISKRLNRDVIHFLGDMRSIRLDRKFDVVIINDAIGYMLSEQDLHATFVTAATHLRPGGISIVSQAQIREVFQDNHVTVKTRSNDEMDVTFIVHDYDPDPTDTIVESLMLIIIRRGKAIEIECDRHRTGLFPQSTWISLMMQAGFDVNSYDRSATTGDSSPAVLVGRKPVGLVVTPRSCVSMEISER